MARTVGIGHQDFAKVVRHDNFYVDKTMFIKEWWENDDEVTLITRPRRFGKTLNMSMLQCFFSNKYSGCSDLFERFAIWQEEKYRNLQGTYPLLFLSFADIKDRNRDDAIWSMKLNIVSLYNEHRFLMEENFLKTTERAQFESVNTEMSDVVATKSIRVLCDYLSRYYGKKVIILLDEYDTPMQEAYAGGYWDDIVVFMRNLFNATFKTNPFLEKAMMTGITRVSKESIFSDLNNLAVVTSTSNKYAAVFGFTQEEVSTALQEFGMSDWERRVKDWYDGFTFGTKTDIYNPWSIINFLDEKKLGTYWANTSSNGLVGKLIREGSRDVKIVMEDLLRGGILRTKIDEQIVFNQLGYNESAIWSLLLASGYLKIEEYTIDGNTGKEEYCLKLTNKEVTLMFQNMIGDWFQNYSPEYNDFVKALLMDDLDAMNEYMNRIAIETFSNFDTGNKPSERSQSEKFYHGFVLGLMVDLSDRYRITSNRESGFGRYDVMLEPVETNGTLPAIIMEFKVYRPTKEANLEETVQMALQQIQDKGYAAELEAKGFHADRIRKYGFAFEGKTVLIG